MRTYSDLKGYLLDFLFPKSAQTQALEALSSGELLHLLPGPREIPDDRTIALFDYTDERVRELIWELKYHGNKNLARLCAEIVIDVLHEELADRMLSEHFAHPLLIPMPTSKKRRRERGYNPTEIICTYIASGMPELTYNPHILLKNLYTESQARTHATKREREHNLIGSMSVAPEYVQLLSKAHVVIFDDVTTSGATFTEARRALRVAGVRKVLCVAIAH